MTGAPLLETASTVSDADPSNDSGGCVSARVSRPASTSGGQRDRIGGASARAGLTARTAVRRGTGVGGEGAGTSSGGSASGGVGLEATAACSGGGSGTMAGCTTISTLRTGCTGVRPPRSEGVAATASAIAPCRAVDSMAASHAIRRPGGSSGCGRNPRRSGAPITTGAKRQPRKIGPVQGQPANRLLPRNRRAIPHPAAGRRPSRRHFGCRNRNEQTATGRWSAG